MKFEKVNINANKKNGELLNLFNAFLESDAEVVVIKDWESDYKNVESLYNACSGLTRVQYKDKVKVSKNSGKVFLERVKK